MLAEVLQGYRPAEATLAVDDRRSHKAAFLQRPAGRRDRGAVGEYEAVAATGDLLAYLRRSQGECILVALNLGSERYSLSIDSLGTGQILLSTHMDRSQERVVGSIALRPDEGVIMLLSELKDSLSS